MDKFVTREPRSALGARSRQTAQENEGHVQPRPPRAKRQKRETPDAESDAEHEIIASAAQVIRRAPATERQDTPADACEDLPSDQDPPAHSGLPTLIESALPEIKADDEAIEEYEVFRASSQGDKPDDVASRFVRREWVRGKSSLYVDAFNLALSTVLADESHLFDAREHAVFDSWAGLSYDAQYL